MRRAILAVALLAVARADADPDTLSALLARTDAVAKEVARIRGLRLKKPIPNEVVDKDELRARLLKMAGEEKTQAETAAEGLALARWGMIPLATDYEQMLVDLMTEQIAGYYDPETKKLTISQSAGDDPQWAEMVLAHELDHGLQDQTFDLHAFEDLPNSEGDASAARRALVEGDGIALMLEVMVQRANAKIDWANPEVAASIEKAMAMPGGGTDDIDKAPLAIRESMLFPYREGFGFVAALRRRQPWSAVDAAFKRPPKSTEQIIHPERYLADDPPIPIEASAPPSLKDYTLVHNTVWGELGFDLWLRSHGVDERAAADAAAGWGGDRVIALAKPDKSAEGRTRSSAEGAAEMYDKRPEKAIGIARFEWDSEADAIEAAEAANKALAESVVGAALDHGRYMGTDGTVSWLERKGASLVIAVGVPAWAADRVATEVWTTTGVAKKPKPKMKNASAK